MFLTDFVGCLPMEEATSARRILCADRNADDIEHVARYPWVRDRAIFVGNPEDVPDLPFGPGLPASATGRSATSPSPATRCRSTPRWPTPTAARHGYRTDEKLVIAAVGGTAVGAPLLQRSPTRSRI